MREPARGPVPAARSESTSGRPFEEFFEAEHGRLLQALYVVTGDRHEAEELMQEAFLSLWERWDRVGRLEDPTGYLYRTAMNAFRSRARRALRAARRAVGSVGAVNGFRAAEARETVERALASLPTRQRAALVMTELLGYGAEEAGKILRVRPGTVRSLASQGRAALRRVLKEETDE